jgi:hypothetical protein
VDGISLSAKPPETVWTTKYQVILSRLSSSIGLPWQMPTGRYAPLTLLASEERCAARSRPRAGRPLRCQAFSSRRRCARVGRLYRPAEGPGMGDEVGQGSSLPAGSPAAREGHFRNLLVTAYAPRFPLGRHLLQDQGRTTTTDASYSGCPGPKEQTLPVSLCSQIAHVLGVARLSLNVSVAPGVEYPTCPDYG